jgi:hypothetical protein
MANAVKCHDCRSVGQLTVVAICISTIFLTMTQQTYYGCDTPLTMRILKLFTTASSTLNTSVRICKILEKYARGNNQALDCEFFALITPL